MTEKDKKGAFASHKDPYASLVAECIEENRGAQWELYNKLADKMFPICLRYVGERERAKDILHDGFITLFAKLKEYRGEGSFEGWARRIFVTTALMYLRKNDVLKNAGQIETDLKFDDTEVVVDARETAELDAKQLMSLIVSMPEGFRTVFNLFALEGYSHKEISQMTGLSEGGCRSQLSRARVWLQERIKKMK